MSSRTFREAGLQELITHLVYLFLDYIKLPLKCRRVILRLYRQ